MYREDVANRFKARTMANGEANERAQPSTAESKSGDPSLPA